MSATFYGGASQMVGIELFGQKIAPWLIVLSIFAVNFRHVLYSAAVGPAHRRIGRSCARALGYFVLTDPQYRRNRTPGRAREPVTFAWYMGRRSRSI